MQYLNKLNDVKQFDLDTRLVVLLKNKSIIINNKSIPFKTSVFYNLDKDIYSSKDFYIDKELSIKQVKKFEGKYFSGIFHNNILLYTDFEKFYFFDKSKNEIVYSAKHFENKSISKIFTNSFICISKDNISYYDISTGDKKWEFHFSEIFQILPIEIYKQKIEIINNKIIFYAHHSYWKSYCLSILDIYTGKQLYNMKDFGPEFFVHKDILYSISRGSCTLKIIDPETYKIKEIDLSKELGDYVFETECQPYFNENELIASFKVKNSDIYSLWGIINLESYKLEYSHEMLINPDLPSKDDNRTFISEIKANNEVIGIKTQGNILHVFKRN